MIGAKIMNELYSSLNRQTLGKYELKFPFDAKQASFSFDHDRLVLVCSCWRQVRSHFSRQVIQLILMILGTMLLADSVTRWLDFLIFGHLQQEKVAQNHNNVAKIGSKFCQTLNNPSTIWQRFIKFCQRGEISPNLVTLLPRDGPANVRRRVL